MSVFIRLCLVFVYLNGWIYAWMHPFKYNHHIEQIIGVKKLEETHINATLPDNDTNVITDDEFIQILNFHRPM